MDMVTHLVGMLRPSTLKWKKIRGYGDWMLEFAEDDGFVFGLLTSGSCTLRLSGRAPLNLNRGDYVLLREPERWSLSHGDRARAHDRADVCAIDILNAEVGGKWHAESCCVMAGHFVFETANSRILKDLLEPVMVIPADSRTAVRLRKLLDVIDDEARSDQLGREAILQRLLEIMLIDALSAEAHVLKERGAGGLLAALSDERLGAALHALHSDVGATWTVSSLARAAGLSRSVFAGRFRAALGVGPIEYLQRWRMTMAQDRLLFSRKSIEEIAFDCGYGSASAFSIAFRRIVGQAPSRYRASGPKRPMRPAQQPNLIEQRALVAA